MRRFRFSIASLLGVVFLVAIAVAALREANEPWDSGVFAVTLVILLVSTLLAVHRRERRRAFWLGFALWGWTYLVASLIPPVESRLPTTKGLAFLDSKLPGRSVTARLQVVGNLSFGTNNLNVQNVDFTYGSVNQVPQGTVVVTTLLGGPNGTPQNFVNIGQALISLVFALAGAIVSRYLYDQHEQSLEMS